MENLKETNKGSIKFLKNFLNFRIVHIFRSKSQMVHLKFMNKIYL